MHDYRIMGETCRERFKGGKDGTLWYYRAILEAFRQTGSTPLIEELERVVLDLEQLVSF